MSSPVAIAIVGRARFDLPRGRFCIRGHLRSANIGLERIIANVVSNPAIRFLIVCGREEGHLPADALLSLIRNGVDGDMRIVGTRAQLPFVSDVTQEAVARFRDQVRAIDLVYPKESSGTIDWTDPMFDLDHARLEQLEGMISECERTNPGPYPGGPMTIQLPEPLMRSANLGKLLESQVDRISTIMLRRPSEKLATSCDDAIVSDKFQILLDPIDGTVVQVPSLAFYHRMKRYLMGEDLEP